MPAISTVHEGSAEDRVQYRWSEIFEVRDGLDATMPPHVLSRVEIGQQTREVERARGDLADSVPQVRRRAVRDVLGEAIS